MGESKASKKSGRNKVKATKYAAMHTQERNKVKRLVKHLKSQPHDGVALRTLRKCEYLTAPARAAIKTAEEAISDHNVYTMRNLQAHLALHFDDLEAARRYNALKEKLS